MTSVWTHFREVMPYLVTLTALLSSTLGCRVEDPGKFTVADEDSEQTRDTGSDAADDGCGDGMSIDADCDGVSEAEDCDDDDPDIRYCGNCTEALSSGTYSETGPATLDLDRDGKPEVVRCDQTSEGGGWLRCAWIDYVAGSATTTHDAKGDIVATNTADSTLGPGGLQALKAACFDLLDESGLGVTHILDGAEGEAPDFAYWAELSTPVEASEAFALIAPGPEDYACSNAATVDVTWISAPDSPPRWFLFGADDDNVHVCTVNGEYSGTSRGLWSQHEPEWVANSWIELSNLHFNRLGTRSPEGSQLMDGVLEIWIR